MAYGKTVRIYFEDGTPSGIRHAEVVGWTGQALFCPRTCIDQLKNWPEAQRPGVYFLFGEESSQADPIAYIGEAEVVLDRLTQHKAKDFWREAIIFTNKDDNLTKSHVRYLEARLVGIAKEAQRYLLENGNVPQQPLLPRSDRDAMEEFIIHSRILLAALGHRVLDPVAAPAKAMPVLPEPIGKGPGEAPSPPTTSDVWYLNYKHAKARGIRTDEGFVVLAGSEASIHEMSSLGQGWSALRQDLIKAGILKLEGDMYVFTKDRLFGSSSAAAAIVTGQRRNGPESWKNSNDQSLKQVEASQ